MNRKNWLASCRPASPILRFGLSSLTFAWLCSGLLLFFLFLPPAFSQVEEQDSELPAALPETGALNTVHLSVVGMQANFSPSLLSQTLPATAAITTTFHLPLVFRDLPEQLPPTPLVDLLMCDKNIRAIPNDIPAGVSGEITSDDQRLIVDLDVYVLIDHTKVGDLKVALENLESGKRIVLVDRPGFPERYFGCPGRNLTAILDDEASQSIEGKCSGAIPSISGAFVPHAALNGFAGDPLGGTWALTVSDHSEDDSGVLRAWCMDVTVTERMPIPTPTPEPPSLPDEARIYNISGLNQALPLDCESRSAVDLAAYFGKWIGERAFFDRLPVSDNPDKGFVGNVYGAWGQIPPSPYGVHAEPIAALLRDYGLNASARRYISWDDVRLEIAEGRPVQVWVIGNSSGWMPGSYYPVYYRNQNGEFTIVSPYEHTVIVIGYTPTSVTLLDGAKIYTRSLDQFLDSWSVLRNMAVTIDPDALASEP